MEDYKARIDADQGRKAKELLENPLLLEALDTIEKELTHIWKTSRINQPELREESWLTLRAMERFQAYLTTMVNNGKIALAEMLKAEAQKEAKESLPPSD